MIDINERKNKLFIAIIYTLGLAGFLLPVVFFCMMILIAAIVPNFSWGGLAEKLLYGAFLVGLAISVLNIILIIAELVFIIRTKKPFREATALLLPFIASIISLAFIVIFVISINHPSPHPKSVQIKGDLANLRVVAEMYYDDATKGNGTYTGFCSDSNYTKAQTVIMLQNGGVTPTCNVSAEGWCVSSVLPDGTNWCVDSLGNSKNTRCGVIITTACP